VYTFFWATLYWFTRKVPVLVVQL